MSPAAQALESAMQQMASGALQAAADAFGDLAARHPEHPIELTAVTLRGLALARLTELMGESMPPLSLPAITPLPHVSFVICSIDPTKFRRVRKNIDLRFDGVPHEIIGIPDARSLCEGYNRGARRAQGDIVVFCHDDIEFVSVDSASKLLGAFEECDVVGVAGTRRLLGPYWSATGWPDLQGQVHHPALGPLVTVSVYGLASRVARDIQAVDGLFIGVNRDVLDEVVFDETRFDGWDLYDLDFSFSAYLRGYSVGVCNDLLIRHWSTGKETRERKRYAQRFLEKHAGALKGAVPAGPPGAVSIRFRSDEEWRQTTACIFG